MPDHWPLAKDEVNFMGDAVAVVIATTATRPRTPWSSSTWTTSRSTWSLDMEEAIKEDAPLVHEDLGTNTSFVWPLEVGDVDGAFEQADVVVKERYIQQRLIPNAIEPRAVVAQPEPTSDGIVLYTATQVPHIVRMMLSPVTGIPDQQVQGGGA